jgi:hypothetical protein
MTFNFVCGWTFAGLLLADGLAIELLLLGLCLSIALLVSKDMIHYKR